MWEIENNIIKHADGFSTTFVNDFIIAVPFGEGAIKETFDRCVNGWKDDYKYFTDIAIATNALCWHYYGQSKSTTDKARKLSELFGDLYYKSRAKFYELFKDKEAREYFFEETD